MEYFRIQDIFENPWDCQNSGVVNFVEIDSDNYQLAQKWMNDRKVIDGYDTEQSAYIVKNFEELEMNAECYKGVYYRFEHTAEAASNLKQKMIVLFAPMSHRYHTSAEIRMFGTGLWPQLINRVAANTSVLRIADSNLMSGSWYRNTSPFSDNEERIQELISKIARDYEILPENIICYGESRGGAGAVLHGIMGNYPSVSLDPTFDVRALHERLTGIDSTLIENQISPNMIKQLNLLLEKTNLSPEDTCILTSSSLMRNYPVTQKLHLDKISVVDVDYRQQWTGTPLAAHQGFIQKNYPLALFHLNEFLYRRDSKGVDLPCPVKFDEWDVYLPDTSGSFLFKITTEGLEIKKKDSLNPGDLYFPLKTPLEIGETYRLVIKEGCQSKFGGLSLGKIIPFDNEQMASKKRTKNGEMCYEFTAANEWDTVKIPYSAYLEGWETIIKSIIVEKV